MRWDHTLSGFLFAVLGVSSALCAAAEENLDTALFNDREIVIMVTPPGSSPVSWIREITSLMSASYKYQRSDHGAAREVAALG